MKKRRPSGCGVQEIAAIRQSNENGWNWDLLGHERESCLAQRLILCYGYSTPVVPLIPVAILKRSQESLNSFRLYKFQFSL